VGTYAVKVVALSGGKATTEVSKTVSIVNPISLPLDLKPQVKPIRLATSMVET